MLQRAPVTIRTEEAAPRPESRMHPRRPGVGVIDISPPLDPSGLAVINQDRRRVSLRWLFGSVLTALSGATLIAGAIVIALQGDIARVERPQRMLPVSPETGEERGSSVRREDLLVRREIASNNVRQEFKAPITVKAGDREVIRTRDFVRINAPLSLTAGNHARSIAPFNPLNLFADSETASANAREVVADVTDADVSIVKRDLDGLVFLPGAPGLSADEALAQILAEDRLMSDFSGRSALPQAGRMMLFRSLRQDQPAPAATSYASLNDMPFTDIDVRVVPENVTLMPKRTTSAGGDQSAEERLAGTHGDLVLKALTGTGMASDDAQAILSALGLGEKDKLRPGQFLAILYTPASTGEAVGDMETSGGNAGADAPSAGKIVGRVTLRDENGTSAIAALTDDGKYVPVLLPSDELRPAGPRTGAPPVANESGPGVALYESVHETAARYEVPDSLVRDLIPLFAADTDFQRRVASGESLELLYTNDDDGAPELLYAALTVDGETKRLFRFQPPADGTAAFYDPDGRSLQKFLIRKPIAEGRMTSGFGMRYHPVMNYAKMHTGVDWADRIGTPILAAGDGTVIKAGWDSGYGRRTEVQHTNGYVTTYSHQSRFARGISPGAKVRQGQVIGYLGNTGLSTGPHLHYEVMVNGRFVDPLKIKLPRSNELAGNELEEFAHQRDQVKELLARSQTGGVASLQ